MLWIWRNISIIAILNHIDTNPSLIERFVSVMNQGMWHITQGETGNYWWKRGRFVGDNSREDQRKSIGWRHNHGLMKWSRHEYFTLRSVILQSLALIWNIKLRDPWIWHTWNIINNFYCGTYYRVLASIWHSFHWNRLSGCDTVYDSIDKGRGGNFTN